MGGKRFDDSSGTVTNLPPPRVLKRGFAHLEHGVDGELNDGLFFASRPWAGRGDVGFVGVLSCITYLSAGGLLGGVYGCEWFDVESESSVREGVEGGALIELCEDDEFIPDRRERRRSISRTTLDSVRGEGLNIVLLLVGFVEECEFRRNLA